MKPRLLIAWIAFSFTAAFAKAEWIELKDEAGQVVEIVADFEIHELSIDPKGTVSFKAKTMIDGEELGLLITLSEPTEESVRIANQRKKISVIKTKVDITSIGAPTERLEKRLNQEFKITARDKFSKRVIGLYGASSPQTAASIEGIMLLRTMSADISRSFDLQLVIDARLGRMTAHFCEIYGGPHPAHWARKKWIDAHKK